MAGTFWKLCAHDPPAAPAASLLISETERMPLPNEQTRYRLDTAAGGARTWVCEYMPGSRGSVVPTTTDLQRLADLTGYPVSSEAGASGTEALHPRAR